MSEEIAVQILDLAHNRDGFEDEMIVELQHYLKVTYEITANALEVRLSTNPAAAQVIVAPTAVVIVVVSHGTRSNDPVAHVGDVTFAHGDFLLDTPVDGMEALTHLGAEERLAIQESIQCSDMLSSFVVTPKAPYALVWYCCNSDSPDVFPFHEPNCRATVSFMKGVYRKEVCYVGDIIRWLCSALQHCEEPDIEGLGSINQSWDLHHVQYISKKVNSILFVPPARPSRDEEDVGEEGDDGDGRG